MATTRRRLSAAAVIIVHSTARIGAVRVTDKRGCDLSAVPYEPTFFEVIQPAVRQAWDSLPAGLRQLAEEADLVGEIKFGYTYGR